MSHYSGLFPSQLGPIRRPKIQQNGSDCDDKEDQEDEDEENETMHDDFFKIKDLHKNMYNLR